jgi:hypothetical protein|tara:strand:- start:584 stop:1012 length:429 start_codon:yes stop_codon:yes gene_type:complete
MFKTYIGILLIVLSSCSTFKKEVVNCPSITSPKGTEEIIVNSQNNLPVYIGFRGIELTCVKNGSYIDMEAIVNIRSIRNNINEDDYAPIKISLVSINDSNEEYDRDDFKYSQFLLNGKRIIDRITKMNVEVPNKGKVLIGIK